MNSIKADDAELETLEKLADNALDITGAQFVEIRLREDAKVLWINVNGICVLRVCQFKTGIWKFHQLF